MEEKPTKEQIFKDLKQYFKFVKLCRKCGNPYGLDSKREKNKNLCPNCENKKKWFIFYDNRKTYIVRKTISFFECLFIYI